MMALESCEILAIDNKRYFFRLSDTNETNGSFSLKATILKEWYKPKGYDKDPKYYLMPVNLIYFNTETENTDD